MEALTVVAMVAVLVEALVQVLKTWVPEGRPTPGFLWPVAGALLGTLLCVLGRVDALALLGIRLAVPGVGSVLTGILVSRGASFLHDVWSRARDGGVT